MELEIIQRICLSEWIYALKDDTSYASVESMYETDDDGLPIEAMCIWSSLEKAKENQIDYWSTYQIEKIALNDFLENWCIGMFTDGLIFCLELDLENDTQEVQPLNLAYQIAKLIQEGSQEIQFCKYQKISDYIEKIRPFVIE